MKDDEAEQGCRLLQCTVPGHAWYRGTMHRIALNDSRSATRTNFFWNGNLRLFAHRTYFEQYSKITSLYTYTYQPYVIPYDATTSHPISMVRVKVWPKPPSKDPLGRLGRIAGGSDPTRRTSGGTNHGKGVQF